jgi:LytT family two-component system sensor histidine kinase NatK
MIHFVIWGKFIYDHPSLWAYVSLIGFIGYLLSEVKVLKLYPFLLTVLSLKKTAGFIWIQVLFLVMMFLSVQYSVQLLALSGSFICEIIRIKNFPDLVKDQKNLEKLSKQMEEMDRYLLTIRSQRHDFLKHVSAIGHLMEQESNKDAKEYLEELVGEYEGINSTLKGESTPIGSILFKYKKILNGIGTNVTYKLDVPVSSLPLKKINQVQLLENLLENATDAIRGYHALRSKSSLSVSTAIHSGIYILQIENSAFFKNRHILDSLFEKFEITSKHGEHQGLGTYIISSLVKSHHGILTYQFQNDELKIIIKLPIIAERNKTS